MGLRADAVKVGRADPLDAPAHAGEHLMPGLEGMLDASARVGMEEEQQFSTVFI